MPPRPRSAQELAPRRASSGWLVVGRSRSVGRDDAVAPASRDHVGAGQEHFGRLELSVDSARALRPPTSAHHRDGRRGPLRRARAASTADGGAIEPPPTARRATSRPAGSPNGGDAARARVLRRTSDPHPQPGTSRTTRSPAAVLLAGGILLGFLVLAMTFAVAVTRSLQAHMARFLAAAHRLRDFSTGQDDRQRRVRRAGQPSSTRCRTSWRNRTRTCARSARGCRLAGRIGETFARTSTATRCWRSSAHGGRRARRTAGEPAPAAADRAQQEVVRAASSTASTTRPRRRGRGAADRSSTRRPSDVHAWPIRQGTEGGSRRLLTIAPRPAVHGPRSELQAYLAGTAGISLQNVDLHEAVSASGHDDLTAFSTPPLPARRTPRSSGRALRAAMSL